MPGTSCGAPAAWHIRWDRGPASDDVPAVTASLACPPHADEWASSYAWYARHPATAACSSPDPTWQPNSCTTDTTTKEN